MMEDVEDTCGIDLYPYFPDCVTEYDSASDCLETYFQCIGDAMTATCDPAIDEPNFLAALPCAAFADCQDPQ